MLLLAIHGFEDFVAVVTSWRANWQMSPEIAFRGQNFLAPRTLLSIDPTDALACFQVPEESTATRLPLPGVEFLFANRFGCWKKHL